MVDAVADDKDAVIDAFRAAKEFERVGNSAHVELHGVSVEADRNGSVFSQPLSHLGFILRYFQASGDHCSDFGFVKVTDFVFAVVGIIFFEFQA